ncbi:MAG TPA: PadR family transcriptional regulator [Alcanivoracaceae bacterium]|nr:PadR family transcriptional regulator [Alcanivoracaceae bacterium]
MSLPHALLTSLIEKPSSGSELSARFDRSIGHFWHASHQQIYRELAKLEQAGWVESFFAEEGERKKKTYQVLPAGREELKRWLSTEENLQPVRSPLMVRMRAAAVVGNNGLLYELERHLAQHEEKLEHYLALQKRDQARFQGTSTAKVQMMILESGIKLEYYWIKTIKEALEVLKEHPEEIK